jgi:uncharacterized protein YkwD
MRVRTMVAATAAQLLVCGVIGGASAVEASAADCANAAVVPVDVATSQQATAAVVCLINAERAKRGLKAVTLSRVLSRASVSESADMVRLKYFSHVSPAGLTLRTRAARAGYRKVSCPPTLGEVLAFGSGADATAASLVASLMADPAHKAVVLDRRYRDAGIGLALGAPMDGMDDGGATLALSFGRR